MSSDSKQQSSADSTLREDPTIDSAPARRSPARTVQWESSTFSLGDLIVEDIGYGAPRFGIVVNIHNKDRTLSVQFSDGVDYAFIGYCLPCEEWLRTVSLGDT